jgi:hypothetical protein
MLETSAAGRKSNKTAYFLNKSIEIFGFCKTRVSISPHKLDEYAERAV